MATPLKDKDILKPNPHPYAIKTTSTALLSRSNSSSQSAAKPRHNYIPSPSPSPTRSRINSRQAGFGYGQGNGHRYSKSLTSESPRPLPVPPSPSPTRQMYSNGHGHSPSFDVDLPANPKLWTPSQLATYLATALRVRSGETLDLPAPVARDIAAFVKNSKITGKEFLRFNEEDLNNYGINKLWSSALLAASRSLRQNVLKGRIWGFGSDDFNNGPLAGDDQSNSFIEHIQYDSASSSSSLDLDRSYSDNEFFAVDFQSNANSNKAMDDDTPVRRTRKGRISLGKIRNGRVKGMVESFERSGSVDESSGAWFTRTRSGSESSASSPEDHPSTFVRRHQTGTAVYHTQLPAQTQYLPPSHQVSEPVHTDAGGVTTDVYDTATEGGHTETEGGQYDTATEGGDEGDGTHEQAVEAGKKKGADEELSMEELLAQIDSDKSGGAHAWERVDSQGAGIITMKHVPPVSSDSPLEHAHTGNGSMKGRPLPLPPASGSPVVFLPASQTLSSQSTGGGSQRPLPTPGSSAGNSSGTLSPHIHAPTPRHGSLRGLGASWNAIDADGVVKQLTGSVESLVSATDFAGPESRNDSLENSGSLIIATDLGASSGSGILGSSGKFGSSDGWIGEGSDGDNQSRQMSKRRLRLSGSGATGVVSRKSSGGTRKPGITEIFGLVKEDGGEGSGVDVSAKPAENGGGGGGPDDIEQLKDEVGDAGTAARKPLDLERQLSEKSRELAEIFGQLAEKDRLLADRDRQLAEYEAEKILWVKRVGELEKELGETKASAEEYKVRLEEVERKVEGMVKEEEERRRKVEDAERDKVEARRTVTVRSGVGLGLLMSFIPRTVEKVFGSQEVSLHSGASTSESSALHAESSATTGGDIELGSRGGQSSSSSPASSSSSSPPSHARNWKDWLSMSPVSLYTRLMDDTPTQDHTQTGERHDREPHPWANPGTIRALPPYVLLVGLGVAAIVLRVVMRRVGYRLGMGMFGMRR